MPNNELSSTLTTMPGGALVEALISPDLESIFWIPSRIGAMSAWWGHVPFAHWFVSAIRPTMVVELGTHNGVSYGAFCEAMQRRGIAGRCYAIDTWKGDEHAGIYDESVYRGLSVFNQERYGAFSELLRLSFDEAVPYFPDGSIDLLHIDGLHTYDAVRHDFEQWLPKLSNRAIVLLHDINVREREFGVWRLWTELVARYPSFEFLHGHGLGILAVGNSVPPLAAALCDLNPAAANLLRERFAQFGAHWIAAGRAERIEQQTVALAGERERLETAVAEYARQDAHHRTRIAEAEERAKAATAEATAAAQQAPLLRSRISRQVEQIAGRDLEIERLQAEIERLRQEIAAAAVGARQSIASSQQLVRALQIQLAGVLESTSWRVTAPLRNVATAVRARKLAPQPAQIAPGHAPTDVELIAASGLFDENHYAGTQHARAIGVDPILHYLREGEAAGLEPSALFDPVFYRERHTDLNGSDYSSLVHYILFGRKEGRSVRSAADSLVYPTDGISPGRETVIVAVHEATRTGAAILAWNIVGELEKRYNVVVLLKEGGPIEQAFSASASAVVALPKEFVVHGGETDALVRKIVQHYAPKYAIANSVETRYFVPSFERANIPTVTLIHEFSTSVRPLGTLHELFQTASHVVFSAQVVANSALKDYRSLEARHFDILAQGVCRLPPDNAAATANGGSAQGDLSRLPDNDGSVLVIGIGTITIRKGVEFFIAAAASVRRRHPTSKIAFAWVGKCYWFDEPYRDYLNEQIKRADVGASFTFLGEFEDLEPVYARADICFLSSRLDPLPNIAIDSAVRGIPVICFDQASGFADILKSSGDTQDLVVPYLDADAAARLIVELADDPGRRAALSEAMRIMAAARFDMARYVEAIDARGSKSAQATAQERRDHQLILRSQSFNAHLYLGPLAVTTPIERAISRYLHASRLVAPRGRPRTGMLVRRPMEGFHPLIYASESPDYDETKGEDPLTHYLRTERPQGRWQHEIIRPHAGPFLNGSALRIAVHGHFHYPDLLEDFLLRLRRNITPVELLLTTSSDDRAQVISDVLSRLDVQGATVTVMPNRGRNIGPLFTGFSQKMLARFDVIGHFHGKRSPHVDASIGDTWRDFLWEHLLGSEHPMLDVIVDAFASQPTLGLVFPEDPHLNDWDDDRALADDLAARMGLALPLPNHFDFPQGTMFWARPQALKPLMDLGLTWDDYPAEPVPPDGTSLHALERLIPFSAMHTGHRYATTYLEARVR